MTDRRVPNQNSIETQEFVESQASTIYEDCCTDVVMPTPWARMSYIPKGASEAALTYIGEE